MPMVTTNKQKKKGKRRQPPRLIANGRTHTVHPTGTRLGFPSEKSVTLPYAANLTVTAASGLMETYQYRLNSCFDPDLTSTGHQPLAFDQWSLFYNHYVVTDCRWTIELVPQSGNCMVAFYVSDDATIPTSSVTELLELGAQGGMGTIYEPVTLSGSVDVAGFLNRPRRALMLDSDLRAFTNANPLDVVFGNIAVQKLSGTNSLICEVLLTLEFDVCFGEPKDLARS